MKLSSFEIPLWRSVSILTDSNGSSQPGSIQARLMQQSFHLLLDCICPLLKYQWNFPKSIEIFLSFFFSSFEFHIVFRFRHSFHYPLLFSSFSLFSSLSMHFFSFLFFLFTWGCWKRLRHNAFLKSLENDQTPFSFLILNWVRKFQLTRVRIFSSSLVCFSSVFL